MIRLAEHAPNATNSNASGAAEIAPLSPSCFYFVDTPKAKIERGGLTAKAANARLRLTLRILAAENDKRQREKRLADLAYFYEEAANAGIELSPFGDE